MEDKELKEKFNNLIELKSIAIKDIISKYEELYPDEWGKSQELCNICKKALNTIYNCIRGDISKVSIKINRYKNGLTSETYEEIAEELISILKSIAGLGVDGHLEELTEELVKSRFIGDYEGAFNYLKDNKIYDLEEAYINDCYFIDEVAGYFLRKEYYTSVKCEDVGNYGGNVNE